MSDYGLPELDKLSKSHEVLDFLVEKGLIKEEKFLKQLAYEKELDQLQYKLLKLQEYLISNNKRLLLIFEGRDTAGKGGAISRTIAKLNPKNFRVSALPKPTENEQKQWYFQKYIKNLPMKKEIVLFDRSWYNRAVVEPVFGFCTEEEHESFMKQVVPFEKLLIEDGIIIIKFFLSISKEEQERRLNSRAVVPLKQFKLGDLDKQAIEKWDDYSFYIDKMLRTTSTKESPWVEIITDNKKKARLEILKYILQNVEGYSPDVKIKSKKKLVKVWTGE